VSVYDVDPRVAAVYGELDEAALTRIARLLWPGVALDRAAAASRELLDDLAVLRRRRTRGWVA